MFDDVRDVRGCVDMIRRKGTLQRENRVQREIDVHRRVSTARDRLGNV